MLTSRWRVAAGIALALIAGAARAQTAGDVSKGRRIYEDRCSGCHSRVGSADGPGFAGVVGRRAGTNGRFPYTAALKASGVVWTEANLDRYLTNPGLFVPGTAMQMIVSDETERRDLIAYLATLRP